MMRLASLNGRLMTSGTSTKAAASPSPPPKSVVSSSAAMAPARISTPMTLATIVPVRRRSRSSRRDPRR
jgi:hypothetical protein